MSKYHANKGLARNKKPLKNIVYTVDLLPFRDDLEGDTERMAPYQYKDLGYLVLYYRTEGSTSRFYHGLITPEELKEKIGVKQWAKFGNGKREFIIQRRVDGKNVPVKK